MQKIGIYATRMTYIAQLLLEKFRRLLICKLKIKIKSLTLQFRRAKMTEVDAAGWQYGGLVVSKAFVPQP